MNPLRDDILQEHSKAQTLRIVQRIGDDQTAFDELIQLFFNDEYRVVQRAAWAVSYCLEAHPEWTAHYLPQLLKNLHGPVPHDAVKRNTVRALQHIEIPAELAGEAADILFRFTTDPREPVAVRCFSINTLFNLCKHEPDLLEELRLTIEDILENDTTPGLRSRCNRTLKDIAKLTKH
ncbi:MAG: hypothetical protein IT258_15830 [Saprospiraceae bacterium]|nr:hypothetical protein [Saprospiraceae bacterium]